jgi:hypothetical protein
LYLGTALKINKYDVYQNFSLTIMVLNGTIY